MQRSTYSPALVDLICDRMAGGEALRDVLESLNVGWSQFWKWRARKPAVTERYEAAKVVRAHRVADQIVSAGIKAETGELDASQARTAINGYMWAAGKLSSQHYGKRAKSESTTINIYSNLALDKPAKDETPGGAYRVVSARAPR